MSYREVDASIVTRVCNEWLGEFSKDLDAYMKRMESRNWKFIPTREDRQLETKEKYQKRVLEILSLSNCPASLNRIVQLSAEDCYILFEVYK